MQTLYIHTMYSMLISLPAKFPIDFPRIPGTRLGFNVSPISGIEGDIVSSKRRD